MTDLPSHDEIYEALRDVDIGPLGSLAAFYLSGRLVDRLVDRDEWVDHSGYTLHDLEVHENPADK